MQQPTKPFFDIAWREELRAVLALSFPLAATNFAQMAMATTDVLMMGRIGADTIAAGTLGVNLYVVFLIFGIGLMNAASPFMATALGRDRAALGDVRRTVQQSCWAAACISVPSWLVLWWTEPILILMGQNPALSKLAGTYVHALQWSMLPFLCYLVLRAFVSALERPMLALAIGLTGVGLNALGNWCLMLGHCGIAPMGIAGSGLSTTLTDVLMFGAMAFVVWRDPDFARYRLSDNFMQPDWERFRAVWRLGLPMAATTTFEVTIFNAAVFLMGLISTAALAAHSIAIQIAALAFMVPMGIGQAATVRVGLAFGAGDRQAIRRAGWTAFGVAMAFALLTSATMVLAPHALIGLFLDISNPTNATIVQFATTFLALAALFQIADGAQGVGAGMLRGLHDGRTPMLFALFGYWGVGLPLGAALAFGTPLGGIGIWIGLAAGLAVVALLMISRWAARERLGLVQAPRQKR